MAHTIQLQQPKGSAQMVQERKSVSSLSLQNILNSFRCSIKSTSNMKAKHILDAKNLLSSVRKSDTAAA